MPFKYPPYLLLLQEIVFICWEEKKPYKEKKQLTCNLVILPCGLPPEDIHGQSAHKIPRHTVNSKGVNSKAVKLLAKLLKVFR